MSLALSGLGVIAPGSPLLGGLLASAAGWRAALALVALVGAATLACVAWRLPKRLPQRNPQALQPRAAAARTGATVLAQPAPSVAWALLVGVTYGGLFTVLAARPSSSSTCSA